MVKALSLATLLFAARTAGGQVVADSAQDFPSASLPPGCSQCASYSYPGTWPPGMTCGMSAPAQPVNGWYYGYFGSTPTSAASFTQFANFDCLPGFGLTQNPNPNWHFAWDYPLSGSPSAVSGNTGVINRNTQAPNGDGTAGPATHGSTVEVWPVRRWVNSSARLLSVRVLTAMTIQPNNGNGVNCYAYLHRGSNTSVVWSRELAHDSGLTADCFYIEAEADDVIDFAVDPKESNSIYDDTLFQIVIRAVTSTCARADANNDCLVDGDDISEFIACYFASPPCPDADFDGDADVDPDDLADFVATHFDCET
mgnify:CR=1 FL=1